MRALQLVFFSLIVFLSHTTHTFSEKTQQACEAINEKFVFYCFLFIHNLRLGSIIRQGKVIRLYDNYALST